MSVPKLRFKEFDGEWDLKSLGDCFSLFSGYAFPSSASVDNGIRWLKIADVGIQEMTPNNLSFLPNDFKVQFPQFIVSKNDYVIALTRPILNKKLKIAKVGEFYDGALLNQRVAKIVSENNNLDFIYSLLQKSKTVEELENSIAGTDPPNLSLNEVKGIVLGIPKVEEQTKIASFLSAVDEKISQLTQKHELLSQYKQGMMQKLFSQQIRFKADDGSEFGEWEEKSLKDFIINHVGGAALTPNDFVSESEYEVIPKKAITFNGKLSLDENSPTYCTKSFFEENLKNTVNKDYLITVLRDLVPSGPSIGYIVQFQNSKTYILAQGVYGFQITSNLNKEFLIHFSNTKQYRLVMKSIMVGSTQVHIRNQDFFSIEIPLPCLEEQTKIANFLSAIDQKIEFVAQQIEQAKQWKKGLLQQMFV